ncbi:N-terminal region of Chorein, a TM vesicle-mediated sorter-domain-containing protein, partial [Schizophyllum fasciatum]
MWWLDPGKEVLNVLFNRILAPYVENLDMNQVGYGIGQGQLTLRNLHLKKGALDKFRLPVDVQEGHLGKFTLSLHWMNLGNQPVEILVEDVYLLVVPTNADIDPAEEEARAQAAKAERLENAELLHMRGQTEGSSGTTSSSTCPLTNNAYAADSPQQQGLIASLIAKIVNNVQVTVKNIHVRYEDKISMPGRPFAAGITLAGFTAVSVNGNWEPAFIESTAGAIHKIATGDHVPEHQFILKPVSGEGRIVMNHRSDKETPHFDVQLLFDELGIVLDDDQYRDAISLVDMYHVYLRQRQ